MCLTTKDPTIKIAEEDIKVYKNLEYPRVPFFKRLFNLTLAYPYANVWTRHTYQKGVVQPNVPLEPIDEGDNEFTVHQGYHSYVEPCALNSLFIIPKGTKYIEGWNNCNENSKNYVSETIIFAKKLK